MNEYPIKRNSTNLDVGYTPINKHPNTKGSRKDKFPVRNETIATQQGVKKR